MKKATKIPTKKPRKTGEFLKFFRMRTTLSQNKAAEVLDYSHNYISEVETGTKPGSALYLATFAHHFKLSTQEKADLLDSVLIK